MYLIKPTIQQSSGSEIELIDNLNQSVSGKALDARQGRVLKGMIPSMPDLSGYATKSQLNNYVSKTEYSPRIRYPIELYGPELSLTPNPYLAINSAGYITALKNMAPGYYSGKLIIKNPNYEIVTFMISTGMFEKDGARALLHLNESEITLEGKFDSQSDILQTINSAIYFRIHVIDSSIMTGSKVAIATAYSG